MTQFLLDVLNKQTSASHVTRVPPQWRIQSLL